MEAVRESWTDERLDDLSRRMELGFAEVKAELRREIGGVRDELRTGLGSVREELCAVRQELHSMQRTMIQLQGIMIAALLGLLATFIATQI
jgi:hypothetical protein